MQADVSQRGVGEKRRIKGPLYIGKCFLEPGTTYRTSDASRLVITVGY